ncbi:MAG: hypothetical protein ACT4OD_06790 [Candidatus Nitrosotenuis sp.]
MSENTDMVDYIREVRLILADSIDTLLNLQHDLYEDKDEEITPVNNVVELVDMSYDISYSQKINDAQTDFMKREPL